MAVCTGVAFSATDLRPPHHRLIIGRAENWNMFDEPPAEDDSVTVERRSPEDVFGLLGNGVRIEILRVLGETPEKPLSFSELRERADIDDSGNFNYHLEKLLGSFVRKDGDYELTHAGEQIVGAMLAGTYTADATVDAIPLDWDCLLCGGAMVAEYFREHARIHCRACEKGAVFPFPPGSLDQFDRDELPAAFARWLRHLVQQTTAGFCHVCAGRVDGRLERLPGGTESDPKPTQITFECRQCGGGMRFSGSTLVTHHPEVEGFFLDHGLDLLSGHPSRAWSRLDRFDSQIVANDPPRVEIIFAHEGETITAEIAPDATVRNVQRHTTDR